MAKIIKVGSQNLTPNKIANPFKTSRSSSTNPFKYNNFEGNTLPFELAADVFSGAKSEKTSKLRMIASSVAGSMNKMRSSIAEPIVNFVNRVRTGISDAWDYARNTNISDVPGIKQVNDVLNTEIHLNLPSFKGLSDSMASIRDGFNSKIEFLNRDIVDIGKDVRSHWDSLIAKIPSKKHYHNMSVLELENSWKEEIALGGAA